MEFKELFGYEEQELIIIGPEDDEEIIMEDPEDDLDDTTEFNPKGPADDADNWKEEDTDEIDINAL